LASSSNTNHGHRVESSALKIARDMDAKLQA
jgi:hypothetical protein